MSVGQVTDHSGAALLRLADQFRDQPRLAAVIEAFAAQIQALEDALWSLLDGRTIAGATGATLDAIGAQIGQPRSISGPDATNDDAYRALLYARVVINTGYTTAEDVLSLLRLIGATDVFAQDLAIATFHLEIAGTLLIPDNQLSGPLQQATAPVTLTLVKRELTGYFGFDGDPDAAGFGVGVFSARVI